MKIKLALSECAKREDISAYMKQEVGICKSVKEDNYHVNREVNGKNRKILR